MTGFIRQRLYLPGILFVSLLLTGCANTETYRVDYAKSKQQAATGQLTAGVAQADITPPPGLPRAGYSMWSTIGEGFRNRLAARAFYLKDAEGNSLAIIQTDLLAGSRILQGKVAEVVARETDIDAGNLAITATHTHSGPGQYLGSAFYNKHASHKDGFDPVYFDFLVEQLSSAVISAYQSQKPAKIATGRTDVWGWTRNRSLQPHLNNTTTEGLTDTASDTFHAINPALYMVRIDTEHEDGSYKPAGAFASFSIHGTGIPERDTFFNADIWAYIQNDVKWNIEQAYSTQQPVVFGAFEGTHGDMAPASRLEMLGQIESRRVGQGIAAHAWDLFQSLDTDLSDTVSLRTATRELDIRNHNTYGNYSICDEAAAGNTLAAAPFEHTSPVIGYLPFFKQGSRRTFFTDNCNGERRILGFDSLQSILEPKDSFPRTVLFQAFQIGDMAIIPLPYEITSESGRRIENRIRETFEKHGQSIRHVMVSSLANGYTGYMTTPEEYAIQFYEGGHTIYGKYTQPVITGHTVELVDSLLQSSDNIRDLPSSQEYTLKTRQFMPDAVAPQKELRAVLAAPEYQHAYANEEGYWAFKWQDVGPGLISLHKPLISIETSYDGEKWMPLVVNNIPVDDNGYDIGIQMLEDEGQHAEYAAYWYNPIFEGKKRQFRFVIQARVNQPAFYSPAFR
ncbi:neutral/alkaline non-lysosomal ceramidase N-terminal domain-containing protein [Kistimonas asteriae]|uniref:neutral/alkaline non-lysosomal ceramidase N-terminal domain-containing protein n=1 Tax=Kistimonas asteriae TaxID=517724 RepID=UPI001BAAC30B|nr:neutral/alkaline non-lysosomal ceramidase N-terminal domain-containing protein [Kistimonas asteriae]